VSIGFLSIPNKDVGGGRGAKSINLFSRAIDLYKDGHLSGLDLFFQPTNNMDSIGAFDGIVSIFDLQDFCSIFFANITPSFVAIRIGFIAWKLSHKLFVKIAHFHFQGFLGQARPFKIMPDLL